VSTARDRPPEEAAEDTSFARGLRVLLTIADRGEIRADELSVLLDTPVSTIYRYLRTLAGFGFVDRQGAGYRLGPRLIIGSGTTITGEQLIRAAGPVLRMLVEETGETAVISRRVGLTAVCLDAVASPNPLRVSIEAGASFPLHAGALSKVLLAYAPPDILDEVIGAGLTSLTPATPTEDRLRRDLAEIVATGLATSENEALAGTVSLGAPVLRGDGIVAGIAVVGPTARCGPAWRARVTGLLPDAALEVARRLGASPEAA
jgi:IclR family acetate operon transcriptional repressor